MHIEIPMLRTEFDSLVSDVLRRTLESGAMTKSKFRRLYPHHQADWSIIRSAVAKDPRIKASRHGLIRRTIRVLETKATRDAAPVIPLNAIEHVAVEIICNALSSAEIQRALGVESIAAVESLIRRKRTGGIEKADLAAALISKVGLDLLAIPLVRELLAKKIGLSSPRRWLPGSKTAHDFCRSVSLPSDFAGSRRSPKAEAYETICGSITLKPLADYQLDTSAKFQKFLTSQTTRVVISMPTGAGKTRVCVESIRDFIKARQASSSGMIVAWVAQKEELLEQAAEAIRQVWSASTDIPSLSTLRNFGVYRSSFDSLWAEIADDFLAGPSILLTTPQSFNQALLDGREDLIHALREKICLTVIDECHLSAAPSYRPILAFSKKVVGASATAFAKEYQSQDIETAAEKIADLYDSNLITPFNWSYEEAIRNLRQRQILSRLEIGIISSGINAKVDLSLADKIDESDEIGAARVDESLALQLDLNSRRELIFSKIRADIEKPSTRALYFGPSVQDAELMCLLLRLNGISAAVISGKTEKSTRRAIISGFKQGKYRVLCNCQVLTTGFDDPQITHIILARPTVSRVLFEQMIGRGLRGPAFGGTEVCRVYDVRDEVVDGRGRRVYLGQELLPKIWKKLSL
jgi:DNA repair protein RadD